VISDGLGNSGRGEWSRIGDALESAELPNLDTRGTQIGSETRATESASLIAPEKLRDYLLSPVHPIGRYKALFFRTLGYDQTSWQQLETDQRSLASLPAEPLESSEYGT
jgi:hypothetical protein